MSHDATELLLDQLRHELPGIRRDALLAPYCAYRVGGPAQLLVETDSRGELVRALSAGARLGLPVTVLGQATNVLVGDGGVAGLVILARDHEWTVRDDVLTASAGTVLAEMIADLAGRGLGGLEFAGNIPGSVGGAVIGNAGAYGRCIADVLIDVELVSPGGRPRTVTPADLQLDYRSSALKRAQRQRAADAAPASAGSEGGPPPADAVVTAASFRLTPGSRTALLEEIARDADLRRSKHPLEYASCGSYFKNPSPQRPAARLIEEAGLKGFAVGRARVSERHANFLVALDGATAADIRRLAQEVRRRVEEVHGVRLEEEVVHLGRD